MSYSFNTDRSGLDWTDKDLKVLERATRRDIEALERENGMDPKSARTEYGRWWSWPFFEPTEKTVLEVAKQLRRLPGSIRAKMQQISEEFFVDPAELKKADRAWKSMGQATKREFVEQKLKSNGDLLLQAIDDGLHSDAGSFPSPEEFDEKKFVEDAVWKAKRDARIQALAILKAHPDQDDEDLKRRIRTLKRQVGIPQTEEEKRAATRERVRQFRERQRRCRERDMVGGVDNSLHS